jgi:L-aminopeptidase/D-esterase-like protein
MHNDITDVMGLRVGHHTMHERPTGCTVVLCGAGAVASVDVRGGAPGTRETDLLAPEATVQQVHAVLLTGGSAFGLDAAGGVMRWLESRGIGFKLGQACVPIVPAAVLFDLWHGDATVRPDAAAGHAACEAAMQASAEGKPLAQGRVGAGAGATVGKLLGFGRASPGGIGSASVRVSVDGGRHVTVGALIAVNAIGDVVDPNTGQVVAGPRSDDGSLLDSQHALMQGHIKSAVSAQTAQPGGATVIGVVATDATLDKAQAKRMATWAHDGLARVIRPAHTHADGDTVFALATGHVAGGVDPLLLNAMVSQVVQAAVLNAVLPVAGTTAR